VEQYKALLKSVPAINAELAAKGHDIPDIASSSAVAPESARKKEKKKANIEATSDEESEEDLSN
jgi:hypothetical protein